MHNQMSFSEISLFFNSIDRVAMVTTTDRSGKIIQVNDNFCEVCGYSRQEILGQDHRLINSGFHSTEFIKNLWKTILGGKMWMGEILNKAKNGSRYWISAFIIPISDSKGEVNSFLAICFDVTQKKEMEREFVNIAQMASLGEMAAGMAHEINNPLAIIQGKVGTMFSALDQEIIDKDKWAKNLFIIEKAAERVAKIIKGLKMFAEERKDGEMEIVSVEKLISEVLELCRQKIMNAGISIEVHCDPSLCLECHPQKIIQVLAHLLSNAYNSLSSTYSSGWIRIQTKAQDENLMITVTDSGPPIAKEIAEKMMWPFFSTRKDGKSVGLGLSVSKGIAKLHRGRLYHDENSPHPSFVLHLPSTRNAVKC